MAVDEKSVPCPHWGGAEQTGERRDHMTFDGALQVTGAVSLIGSFFEKKLTSVLRHAERKGDRRRIQDALLDLLQLDVQYLFELFALQWMKNHHRIKPIHELGRELPSCCFDRRPLHFFVEFRSGLILCLNKPHPAFHEFRDLAST